MAVADSQWQLIAWRLDSSKGWTGQACLPAAELDIKHRDFLNSSSAGLPVASLLVSPVAIAIPSHPIPSIRPSIKASNAPASPWTKNPVFGQSHLPRLPNKKLLQLGQLLFPIPFSSLSTSLNNSASSPKLHQLTELLVADNLSSITAPST
jgi:hypothetical protein